MFNKIRWYFFYKKTIKKNKKLLYDKHGIKIDWVNRMYKTLTLTDDDLLQIKTYGTTYLNEILEKDKSKIENTFLELKILQFVGLMEIEQLNERQIGIAFRYKYFDTAKITSISIWTLVVLLSSALYYLYNMNYMSLLYGGLIGIGIFVLSRIFKVGRI